MAVEQYDKIVWSKEQTALTSCVDPESIKLYPVGGGCNIKSKEAWSGSVSLFNEHKNNALEPLTKNEIAGMMRHTWFHTAP